MERRKLSTLIIILFFVLFLFACKIEKTPGQSAISETDKLAATSTQFVNVTEAAIDSPPTLTLTSTQSPTATQQVVTNIVVDGQCDEWSDDFHYYMQKTGILDVKNIVVYSLENNDSLFVCVAGLEGFLELFITLDSEGISPTILSWSAQTGKFMDSESEYSESDLRYFDGDLEFRIQLSELESNNGKISDIQLDKMGITLEETSPGILKQVYFFSKQDSVVFVDEIDPPGSNEENNVDWYETLYFVNFFNIHPDYSIERFFAPPLPEPYQLVKSESGIIYVQQIYSSLGISTINIKTGEVTRILDGCCDNIANGPGDTALVSKRGAESTINQLHPDGSLTFWRNARSNFMPLFYDANTGDLYGSTYSGDVAVVSEDGYNIIASGFVSIRSVVVDSDGYVYFSSIWDGPGDIYKISPDGEMQLLRTININQDAIDLGLDPSENLYFTANIEPDFNAIDKVTGAYQPILEILSECTGHPTRFVFLDGGRVLFHDPTWANVVLGNLETGEVERLISGFGSNTRAIASDAGGYLYVGENGCTDNTPGRIIKVSPQGNIEIYLDGLPNKFLNMANTSRGLYFTAGEDFGKPVSLYYVAHESKKVEVVPGAIVNGVSELAALPNENVLVWHNEDSFGLPGSLTEYSPNGKVQRLNIAYKTIYSLGMSIKPDGNVFGCAVLPENIFVGPVIYRDLIDINLESGEVNAVSFPQPTDLITPFDQCDVAIDPTGVAWLLSTSDFALYVVRDGVPVRVAENLPIDPWSIASGTNGDVYLSTVGGIFHVFPIDD